MENIIERAAVSSIQTVGLIVPTFFLWITCRYKVEMLWINYENRKIIPA
jgi:hypothetical protein